VREFNANCACGRSGGSCCLAETETATAALRLVQSSTQTDPRGGRVPRKPSGICRDTEGRCERGCRIRGQKLLSIVQKAPLATKCCFGKSWGTIYQDEQLYDARTLLRSPEAACSVASRSMAMAWAACFPSLVVSSAPSFARSRACRSFFRDVAGDED